MLCRSELCRAIVMLGGLCWLMLDQLIIGI
jgi:hypothetical protein